MRVIAGEFRSRKLLSLQGTHTRPTSDRLRETLFNILGAEVEGCVFVDAYAGTGAVGIEALSRGARYAIFIEKHRDAVDVIEANILALQLGSRARVIKGAVSAHLSGIEADILFLDPPYEKEREYRAAFALLEEHAPSLTVIQHSVRFGLAEVSGPLRRTRYLKQGENALSFYRVT